MKIIAYRDSTYMIDFKNMIICPTDLSLPSTKIKISDDGRVLQLFDEGWTEVDSRFQNAYQDYLVDKVFLVEDEENERK